MLHLQFPLPQLSALIFFLTILILHILPAVAPWLLKPRVSIFIAKDRGPGWFFHACMAYHVLLHFSLLPSPAAHPWLHSECSDGSVWASVSWPEHFLVTSKFFFFFNAFGTSCPHCVSAVLCSFGTSRKSFSGKE